MNDGEDFNCSVLLTTCVFLITIIKGFNFLMTKIVPTPPVTDRIKNRDWDIHGSIISLLFLDARCKMCNVYTVEEAKGADLYCEK